MPPGGMHGMPTVRDVRRSLECIHVYVCTYQDKQESNRVPADDGPILEKRRSLPQVGVDVDTIRGSSSSGGESKGEEDLLNRCHFLFVLLIGR